MLCWFCVNFLYHNNSTISYQDGVYQNSCVCASDCFITELRRKCHVMNASVAAAAALCYSRWDKRKALSQLMIQYSARGHESLLLPAPHYMCCATCMYIFYAPDRYHITVPCLFCDSNNVLSTLKAFHLLRVNFRFRLMKKADNSTRNVGIILLQDWLTKASNTFRSEEIVLPLKWIFTACNTRLKSHFNFQGSFVNP